MKITIDRERFKIYMYIGAAYLVLWSFGELVNYPETFLKRSWNNIWLIAYLVVLNYLLFERVLRYLRFTWKRMLLAPVLLWAMLMLYSFGFYAWRAIGIGLHLYFPLKVHESVLKGVTHHVPYSLMSIFFFGLAKHVYDYRKLKEATQRLRIEKQEAELNYLKSQTNPHFLFNTLNNIYSLARDKSDLAPESILRLSKILRFMLYETGGAYIAIEEEVKVIGDYIALEKLRYDESLGVNFSHDVEDMKQSIPPLLLMPLVENAFKHGVSETRSHPFVEIHLSVKKRVLTFVVKNSSESFGGDDDDHGVVGEEHEQRHQERHQRPRESIGLSNLRRQLELLYSDHQLSVRQHESVFTASLKIDLASHV